MDKLQDLINEGFIPFTFSKISTYINSKGEEKKKPINLPEHGNITSDNFTNYCKSGDKGAAIITGKMSNLTVIDFDNINSYNSILTQMPELKNYRTIKTNKGFHIYCKYDPKPKSSTNVLASYPGVDIRNDGGIVFSPPCSYKLLDGSLCKYEDMGGEILPIPEIIMSDIKPDCFVNFTPTKKDKKNPEKQENEPKYQTSEKENLEYISSAIEKGFLDFKSVSDSYDDWRDVGFIFKHTSESKECLELFHKFSMINKSKYDKLYTDVFWKSIKQTAKPLTIGTLKKWIKDQTIKQSDAPIIDTDLEAAIFILDKLKNVFKSCNGRLFYLLDNIWTHDESKINNNILMYVMNLNICSINALGSLIPVSKNIGAAKRIVETLYAHVHVNNNDTELYVKFHNTTKTKICFNDGVLDFKNKSFTLWKDIKPDTIYSTVKINRDYGEYFKNPNRKDINDITSKLFIAAYGDKTPKLFQFLSRAIAGHIEDKRWATYLGNRNSGKGIEYGLLKNAFENYVQTFELGNILYCRKTSGIENIDCSKKLYWLMDLEFTRLAVSQEIPETNTQQVANGKLLKKISGGGDTIIARRNYDRKDTHFTTDTTFYIKGNTDLLVDSNDCNETRVEFNSVVSFVPKSQLDIYKTYMDEVELKQYKESDPTLKDKCQTTNWLNAIVYLIYENYTDKSVDIKYEQNDDGNTLYKEITDNYIITGNHDDFILCNDIHSILSGYGKGKISLQLNAMNILKKKAKSGPNRDKWIYSGIKSKPIEKESEIIMN